MPGIQALCVLFGFVLGINMAKAGLLFSKRDKIVLDCPEEWAQGKECLNELLSDAYSLVGMVKEGEISAAKIRYDEIKKAN